MKEKRKTSILLQVSILFIIAIAITASITYYGQKKAVDAYIKRQTENLAQHTAEQVILMMKEMPAYEWLMRYWYSHSNIMEIEYDANFRTGAATRAKCKLWNKRHPQSPLRYVQASELSLMSAGDQKLYAEIMYSWLITRLNQIKETYDAAFLFCALTDEKCQSQFFLFSARGKNLVRGTEYGQAFILGTERTIGLSQQEAMRDARENTKMLADAGDYFDYYVYWDKLEDKDTYIGLTFSKKELYSRIHTQTRSEAFRSILYQAVLLAIALLMLLFFVLRPLRTVGQNIRLYMKTKDSRLVSENLARIRSRNEIETLAEDVTGLTKEIDDYLERIETITAERERIGTELSLAKSIQKSMLPASFPAFPDRTEFDIFAKMKPAREVGGDFYDFRMIDDDHLYLAIADVSGKGVPAALFMMSSMILLANNAKSGESSPAEILQKTNNSICAKNPAEMFVTVWIGILEISTGRLRAANGGHEYPAVMHPGGRFEIEKTRHGIVLGAMEDMKFPEYEMQLEPGACVFLYTDGIPEATDADDNMFGMTRLLETLNGLVTEEQGDSGGVQTVCSTPPEEILAVVRDAVNGFVKDEPQFDDMTMLCLTYRGPEKEA